MRMLTVTVCINQYKTLKENGTTSEGKYYWTDESKQEKNEIQADNSHTREEINKD